MEGLVFSQNEIEEILDADKKLKIKKGYLFFKRMADIVCSLLAIIVLAPLFIITSIAIRIDSPGKAIFTQERVGKGGSSFKMYKFRSMVLNAEDLKPMLESKNEMSGPMFKIRDDPRVTRVGRFIRRTSIDELPQLFNILKGEMSIVGPRPSLPNEVAQFESWMLKRLVVRPGLTCYWQVGGRNNIDFTDWMMMDVFYVDTMSIRSDIKLILKTIRVLFGDKNAS